MTPRTADNDVNARVAGCQGLVRSIAWKVHRKLPANIDLDDLIAYGQIGLMEAAREFKTELGTQFTTFAYYRIRGSILDGLSKMTWFTKAEFASGRFERMANEVIHAPGDESTASELEEDTNWFRETTRSLGVVYLFSQARQQAEQSRNEIPARVDDPDESSIRGEVIARLWSVVDELPEDERIFTHAVYEGGLNLKEAGEKIGISKAWASRLHGRILKKLARSLAAD